MTQKNAHEVWKRILDVLEDKLQFGFLEQARSVVDVKLEGAVFTLVVADQESERFFQAEVNQQRLFIVCRPITNIEKFQVVRVDSSPIG